MLTPFYVHILCGWLLCDSSLPMLICKKCCCVFPHCYTVDDDSEYPMDNELSLLPNDLSFCFFSFTYKFSGFGFPNDLYFPRDAYLSYKIMARKPKWHKAGVIRLGDLLDGNGKIMNVNAFMMKFNNNCNIIFYYKII